MATIFVDDIFKCIFVTEKYCILIEIVSKFIPKGPIHTKPALGQTMAWCWTGDKPLYEPKMAQFFGAYIRHSTSMTSHF